MRRKTANILAGFLALLCVAFVVLGMRSLWVGDTFRRDSMDSAALIVNGYEAVSEDGYLCLSYVRFTYRGQAGTTSGQDDHRFACRIFQSMRSGLRRYLLSHTRWLHQLRPAFAQDHGSHGNAAYEEYWAFIPYWLPILVTGAWPAWRFGRPVLRRRRERRRIRRGLCAGCGYDLRAHAIGQKCPECGRGIVSCGG